MLNMQSYYLATDVKGIKVLVYKWDKNSKRNSRKSLITRTIEHNDGSKETLHWVALFQQMQQHHFPFNNLKAAAAYYKSLTL